ncbi:MAG: UDP-N-acetylmuramate dehydrogenase [Planctomycetales bacterium]|nr:UDP-N-acetylmuramate dehydrogenase [Planctomycetales bacterium]
MSFIAGFEHFIQPDEPLAPYTWLRLGGPAEYLAEPTSQDELVALVKRAREANLPVRLLGGGSNVLVREAGVRGVVVRLTAPAFCEIKTEKSTITAGGGAKLGHVISTAVREGLAGLEQLVGIPGSVGGALHGNAGGHGGDIGQFTAQATVLTRSGQLLVRERSDMHFAQRHSSLDELAILSAKFELEPEDPQQIARRMQTLWIVKRAEQPAGGEGAGYIFKNPRGGSAASLIEQAGLKGVRQGSVEVSSRSANFFIAHPGAKSEDVLALMQTVENQVAERIGVRLERQIDVW